MVKRLLVLLLVVIGLLIPFTLGYELSDFPNPFIENKKFNVVGVIGAKSQDSDVLAILKVFDILTENYNISWRTKGCPEGDTCIGINLPMSPYEIRLDKDISNISKNIISVGGPCANNITAQIMDLPTTWPECAASFENGSGILKLFNKWNKTQLVVAGYSAEDTKKTAKVIEKYDGLNLNGKEIQVTGYIDDPNFERVITKEERYCEKDGDCILVLSGCPYCFPCRNIKITYSEVIAVNKNEYKCPPKPKEVACIACVGTIDYNPNEDAICVNNKCEKKENFDVIPVIRECPNRTSIDCMPSVSPPMIKYCIKENREWIQKNCNISYSD